MGQEVTEDIAVFGMDAVCDLENQTVNNDPAWGIGPYQPLCIYVFLIPDTGNVHHP